MSDPEATVANCCAHGHAASRSSRVDPLTSYIPYDCVLKSHAQRDHEGYPMTVLLTGATGFIGSQVARALVAEGAKVVAIDREDGANSERLRDIATRLCIVQVDLNDDARVARLIDEHRPTTCIHLAWYAVPRDYLTSAENLSLVASSLKLARLLADAGCERFVAAGTCFEYDTSQGTLDEASRTLPRHLYSTCKLALFQMLQRFSDDRGLSFAWPRFFYQYGPFEQEGRLVPAVLGALLRGEQAKVSSGEQVRDFLHVADVATAVCKVASSSLTGAINIGSGEGVSVRTLVETLAEECERPELVLYGAIPQRAGDPARVVADNAKLRSTGWAPKFDLRAGLRDTVAARRRV